MKGKKEEIRLEERIIKGLKETTHGYKKNETKRMISRANCNAMFLFFLTADSQIFRNVHLRNHDQKNGIVAG